MIPRLLASAHKDPNGRPNQEQLRTCVSLEARTPPP